MSTPASRPAPPHRVYYGWVLVTTLAFTEMTSWGVLYYAFTVFIIPLHARFGWSRSTITGAFSMALLCSGVAGLPVGRMLDRFGPRWLMTAGSCLASVLVLGWAAVDSLTAFYLVWAAIGVTMAAILYEPAFAVVATWFRRERGRALTLLTFVAGFASVIYIPFTGYLVEARGWRGALVVLAALLAVVTILPHALVLRRRPADLGLQPDGATAPVAEARSTGQPERSHTLRTALSGGAFWWLSVAFFLNTLGAGAMFVHLVPYLTDHGYSASFATTATGLVGVMALPGRLVLTPLGDRMPRSQVAAALFVLQTLALVLLLLVHSTAGVVGFVVLFGAGFGAVTPARAALVAAYYGPANYGAINGALAFFLTGARSLAPVGAAVLYDATGSYTLLLWGLTAASTIAVFAVLIAERQAAAIGNGHPAARH